MQTVSVGELKNKLGRYLEDVKRGEEVLIQESDRTIAKIVPMNGNDYESEEAELVAAGVLTAPKVSEIPDSFWEEELPDIELETAVKAITDEREED
ncbi:MAG TPA: type II toxin-antitoxin system Phd/YefM family antitoxin [Pyrinomonadaceae bacterium]|nr:type II toxin-antitoxin system Phd/YefM family antitoxin [Pyrinomonadaceae bacterium]